LFCCCCCCCFFLCVLVVCRTIWCLTRRHRLCVSCLFPTSFIRHQPLQILCCVQDFLVPDVAPKAARELLAGLLCSPPPHDVAAATRQALRGMRKFNCWLCECVGIIYVGCYFSAAEPSMHH
jgi:hypothetical protein